MIQQLACFLLFLSIGAVTARADEIRLKNGDRLTGEIIRMEKDRLTVKLPYADEKVRIDWLKVECISSERDLTVELSDYEVLVGPVTCADGSIRVLSSKAGTTKPISLSELRTMNPATYRGFLTAGGSVATGNTETKAATLSTLFQVRTKRHRFTVEAKYTYGEADSRTTARNSLGSLKYDFFTTDKVYTYAQTLVEKDSFANLNLRNTEGLGVGYQFFEERALNLYAEAGISYFNEDVIEGEDRQDASGRWAAGLDWEAIPDRLRVFHRQEGYYTPSVSAVTLRADQGVRISLVNDIDATLQVDYRFNSRPEAGKRTSDLLLLMGLTYEYAYW